MHAPRSHLLYRLALAAILYLIAASSTANTFVQRWGVGFRIEQMLHHKAPRPFAYRVLSPALVRFMASMVPPAVADALTGFESDDDHSLIQRWQRNFRSDRPGFGAADSDSDKVAYLVCYLYILASLLAFAVVMRVLIGIHTRGSPILQDIAPAVVLLVLPLAYTKGGYIYDFPELVFAGLATILLLRRRWLGYYALLPIAILNKESFVLFGAAALARCYADRDHRRLLLHAGLHALVALPILLAVRAAFAEAPSVGIFEPVTHVQYLASPASWLSFHALYLPAIPVVPGPLNLMVLAVLAWLTLGPAAREQRRLFLLFVTLVAVIGVFFVASGFEDEVRVFGPAIPAMFTLATRSVLDHAAATWQPGPLAGS